MESLALLLGSPGSLGAVELFIKQSATTGQLLLQPLIYLGLLSMFPAVAAPDSLRHKCTMAEDRTGYEVPRPADAGTLGVLESSHLNPAQSCPFNLPKMNRQTSSWVPC